MCVWCRPNSHLFPFTLYNVNKNHEKSFLSFYFHFFFILVFFPGERYSKSKLTSVDRNSGGGSNEVKDGESGAGLKVEELKEDDKILGQKCYYWWGRRLRADGGGAEGIRRIRPDTRHPSCRWLGRSQFKHVTYQPTQHRVVAWKKGYWDLDGCQG